MSTIQLPLTFPVTSHTDHVGPGSTFVAIKGAKEDGIAYIPEALEKGATTIVVAAGTVIPHSIAQAIEQAQARLVFVADSRQALAQLSAQALGFPAQQLKIFGITGTKGKTTTAFILEHLFRTAGHTTALLSTVKNRIKDVEFPTALTTQQPDYLHAFFHTCVQAGVTHVVMEVSAQAYTLQRIHGLKFEGLIFTNFAQEHAEFYPTMDEYRAAKKAILTMAKKDDAVFINADDTDGRTILEEHPSFSSFGRAPGSTASATILKAGAQGIAFSVHYNSVRHQNHDAVFSCPSLIGPYNVSNALGAVAVALHSGVAIDVLSQALLTFTGVPGRMERYPLPNGALCVIDYAHNPSSYEALLPMLKNLSSHLIVVFGCGGDRDATKRPVMGKISADYADLVILTTDNPRSEDPALIVEQIMVGIPEHLRARVVIELDRERAIQKAYAHAHQGSVIALLGKGPEEYQVIQNVKVPFSERRIVQALN